MARRKRIDRPTKGPLFETQDAAVLEDAYEKAVLLFNPNADAVIKRKLADIILDMAARSLEAGETLTTAGQSDDMAGEAVARLLRLTAPA